MIRRGPNNRQSLAKIRNKAKLQVVLEWEEQMQISALQNRDSSALISRGRCNSGHGRYNSGQ